jgi:hypothetical protein
MADPANTKLDAAVIGADMVVDIAAGVVAVEHAASSSTSAADRRRFTG